MFISIPQAYFNSGRYYLLQYSRQRKGYVLRLAQYSFVGVRMLRRDTYRVSFIPILRVQKDYRYSVERDSIRVSPRRVKDWGSARDNGSYILDPSTTKLTHETVWWIRRYDSFTRNQLTEIHSISFGPWMWLAQLSGRVILHQKFYQQVSCTSPITA